MRYESKPSVLIVGAGPTGLAMGAILAREGVPFRLIERQAERSENSRALGVQAGTLEALRDRFGPELPAKMVAAGHPARHALLHPNPPEAPIFVDIQGIPSDYNFILMLPQWRTEEFLEGEMREAGGRIERGLELCGMEEDDAGVDCTLRAQDGSTHQYRATYVIGADGAHSLVRENAGADFSGATYNGDFLLGDLDVSWKEPPGELSVFFTRMGVAAFFPIEKNRYRVVLATRSKTLREEGETISLEEFQAATSELAGVPVTVSNPVWLTRYKIHHRLTRHFRYGRCFLTGDAAHIHSPVGAQGMNTGIQDALSLGYKLARVMVDQADPALLDTYETERRPVAKRVLFLTNLVFRLALHGQFGAFRWMRARVMTYLFGSEKFRHHVAAMISQVEVARADIERRKQNPPAEKSTRRAV